MTSWKKNNLLKEARNIYPADFYEFTDLISSLGWSLVEETKLTRGDKEYLGYVVTRDWENTSENEFMDAIEDYFDGNVFFTRRRYKYAPENEQIVIVVEPDVFDYSEDQLEFEF